MIRIKNLSKSFGKHKALDGISLELHQGKYGLLGPNGSGKTTLIRCLTGLYPVAPKTIEFTQESKKTHQTEIGYLPQHYRPFDYLTVAEYLLLMTKLKSVQKEQQKDEVDRVLEAVNLTHRADDLTRVLSGGMQRRLGIAQSLIHSPQIRIYDEPTVGLDPEERLSINDYFQKEEGDALSIIATHIVDDIEASCNKVIILNEGEVLFCGEVKEILQNLIGSIFEAPSDQFHNIDEQSTIKQYQRDGVRYTRFFHPNADDTRLQVTPTLEDAYILFIRRLVQI